MNKVIESNYNMVSIIDNNVLYNWNLLGVCNLSVLTKKEKEGENRWIHEMMDVLIN